MDDATRVLIVDDETFFREAIRDVLAEGGCACECAASGAEALELAEDPHTGVVVLDLGLPGSDAVDLLQRLREARPDLQVIVLSTHADQERVLESLRRGACDYLAKPLHDEELLLSVQRAVGAFETSAGARRLRGRLRTLEARLGILANLARDIADPETREAIQTGVADAVADVLGASKTSLMLLDEAGERLCVAAATGRKIPLEEFDPVPVGEGTAGRALTAPILGRGPEADAGDGRHPERYDTPSFAVVPLSLAGRSLGVLCAADPTGGEDFDETDAALLRILALQAAQYLAPPERAPAGAAAGAPGAAGLDTWAAPAGAPEEGRVPQLPQPSGPQPAGALAAGADAGAALAEADVELVRSVCDAVTAEVEPARIIEAALRPVAATLNAAPVSLYLRDPGEDQLVREGQVDGAGARPDRARLPCGRGLTGTAFETGHLIAAADPQADPRFDPEVDTPAAGAAAPFLCLPLRFRGKVLGVFRAFPAEASAVSPRTAEVLSAALSAAVRNVLLYRSLVEAIEELARARREVPRA